VFILGRLYYRCKQRFSLDRFYHPNQSSVARYDIPMFTLIWLNSYVNNPHVKKPFVVIYYDSQTVFSPVAEKNMEMNYTYPLI
jgi:hypothetical protein